MTTTRHSLAVSSFLAASLLASVAFAVPTTMATSGRLVDSEGAPVSGSKTITYAMFDAASGGTRVWEEQVTAELDANGFFTAVLGQTVALDTSTFNGDNLWIETTIDNTILTPRTAVGVVPYAAVASFAEQVPWANIADIPMDLSDGDADTLAGIPCADTQIVSYANGTFTCVDAPSPGAVYTAGTGVTLMGNTFAFDTTWGDGRYLERTGGTVTGRVVLSERGNNGAMSSSGAIILTETCTNPPCALILCGVVGNPCPIYRPGRLYFNGVSGAQGDDHYLFLDSAQNRIEVGGSFHVNGVLSANSKQFRQPHVGDASKEIAYVSLEGGENGVYWRGQAKTKGGLAVIPMPEHFALSASEQGMTVHLTPIGGFAPLYIKEQSPKRLVVAIDEGFTRGDVRFNYLVHAERRYFEGHQPVQPNTNFQPQGFGSAQEFEESMAQDRRVQRMLIDNGILLPDGKLNPETARQHGWSR